MIKFHNLKTKSISLKAGENKQHPKICKMSICMLGHSLSQGGQAIYSLCPSTLAQWQYASQQQNSLLITKKENKRKI